jgi:adenine-specific DNA-methyltransferase
MIDFTYMGTKRSLASSIAQIARSAPSGPFLDLFSGISAAGAAVAKDRHIWCNDVQLFSQMLTTALYLSTEQASSREHCIDTIGRLGDINLNGLLSSVNDLVIKERTTLSGGNSSSIVALQQEIAEQSSSMLSEWRQRDNHCLFAATYAGTYFGLAQCLQIDSIRFGIDRAHQAGALSDENRRWALIALCRAVAFASNSTGHFAQYLTPSERNLRRVVSKRQTCVWDRWVRAFSGLGPIGKLEWRVGNKVFCGDANSVLLDIKESCLKPAVIYADPPYTADQYSRFYHIWETLILYDYPIVSGKGQYRPGRFSSAFSLSSKVEEAFKTLIERAALNDSTLIVSYPKAGLLPNPESTIPDMMSQYFKKVHAPIVLDYRHSTLGASKGHQKQNVKEMFFVAH